jgi:2'-5' RNA ligase
MRTFLAIPMAPAVKECYARSHAEWRQGFPGLRWVVPENLHLTLRFFGETPEETVGEIQRRVEVIARGARPFRLSIGEAGCFGSRAAPRVLWFHLDAEGSTLSRVQALCEEAAAELGFESEARPWRSHLTVARNREGARVQGWAEALAASGLRGLEQVVDGISFFQSRLRPGGAEYEVVWKADFAR